MPGQPDQEEDEEEHDVEENEQGVKIKPNWPFIWATLIGLIVIGWCLGLLIHPPASEVIHCPEEDMIQVEPDEGGGVVFFCVDYRD